MACAENNCAEMILNKQRCLLRGYRFLSNKEVMEKLGVIVFFFCEKYWVSTWNKQDIIGWLQYFTEFEFNDNPMQIINATLNGCCIMITLQFRGGHTIFDYQIRGSQNIAEVTLEIYEPLFQSMVTS